MQLNGGKIKETQVSLLLSSRAEMQKVIEKARQASSSAFAITKMSTQTQSAATIANQFAKKLPEAAAVVPPQPPVISLSSYLAQSMQQQQAPPQVSVTQPQQINLMSAYQTALVPNDMSGLGGLTSLPPVSLPAQNAAAVAAYYATLMGPNAAMTYANPIAAGLNVKSPAESLLKSSTYLSDPRGERNRYRSRSPERRSSRRSRSNSRERYPSDSDGKDGSRRRTRFSAAQDRVEIPKHSAMPPVISSSTSSSFSIPPPSNNIWEHPPPQVFSHEVNAQPTNMNAYAFNYNNASAMPTPRNNYKTENSSNVSNASSGSLGNIGTCVKVSNVDSETFYSDLRKFFAGLPIGTNDIKFVNDAKGNRTGAALIRFVSSDSKKKALTKSMWQLKSTQVVITSISEEDFESGMVNVKSANRGNQGNSYRNDDRFDSRNDRFRDRSDSRERDYPKRDRFEGNRGGNHRFDDRPHNNNRDGGNFRQREQNDRLPPRNYRSEDQEKPKEYQPDENFSVLIIDDIPRTANEPDICEAFPNIVSIVIDRYKAYVKFSSHETAKATLENRYIHYIRNKRVFLEAGSEAQFNELARKNGKFDNSENKEGNDNGNGSANAFEPNDDSNSHDSSRNQKPFESRDPRQRNFANDRRNDFPSNGNGGAPNQIKTDCIIMKNMEPDTTIEDVENFFKDLGIYKMRVHILLDKRGTFVVDISPRILVSYISVFRSTMRRLLCRIQVSERRKPSDSEEPAADEKQECNGHADPTRAGPSRIELIWQR